MSGLFRGRHLDAFSGRDVVYCHSCGHEWYQDESGLECPGCHSDVTEIITSHESDPRDLDHDVPSPSGLATASDAPRRGNHDSDPEEEDIERHVHRGPGGMFFTRTTYRSPSRHEPGGASGPIHPADPHALLHRFAEMVSDLDPGRSGADSPPAPTARFTRATVHRSSFGNGQTGFTITTPPVRVERESNRVQPDFASDFALIFGTIMGNITPPAGSSPFGNANNPRANSGSSADRDGANDENETGRGGEQPPHGFPLPFHHLFSAFFGPPGTANWGDVVTSQQELDRIISNLMEANPQSNAAPPASQAALDKLERKKLDSTMIGGSDKVECTICIDELSQGDEVAVLPCKHWFHCDCVVLWLKEHNTCPICRAPIEEKRQEASSSQRSGGGWRNSTGSAMPSASLFGFDLAGRSNTTGEPSTSASNPPPATENYPSTRSGAESSSYRRRDRMTRTASENEQRLNAIRSATFSIGMPGGSGNDTSNTSGTPPLGGYRRNSLSPPSAGPQQQQRTGAADSRIRDRSPPATSSWRFGSASAEQDRDRERESERDRDRDRTSGLFGDLAHRQGYRSSSGNDNNGGGDGGSGNGGGGPRGLASWLSRLGGSGSSSGSSSGNGNSDGRRH